MSLKRTTIAIAVAASIGSSTIASADIINMSFTGHLTLVGGTGNINPNSDLVNHASDPCRDIFEPVACDGIGSRTPISGSATFDTTTGTGDALINPFSFFGNGLIHFGYGFPTHVFPIQAIGDGFGSTDGTLIAAEMPFYWNGNFDVEVTAIFDAAGFFASIGGPGSSWSVSNTGAVSATPDTVFGHVVGTQPFVMTSYNTSGATLGSIFPLSDTGGIAGSPMTWAPFPGQNMAFDFTTINATNTSTPEVPVPAAAWLFGSGLLGLVGAARRRRKESNF